MSSDVIEQFFVKLDQLQGPDQLDHVYNVMDDMLLARDFAPVEDILSRLVKLVPDKECRLSVFLSALTITRPWTIFLGPARSELLVAMKARYLAEYGVTQYSALIQGLD
jgi:hypothetical protein